MIRSAVRLPSTNTMLSNLTTLVVVLASLLLTISFAQNTYYVKPTFDVPCFADTCLTLSEYAAAVEQYFSANTTFTFLPGDHYLGGNIAIENVSNIMLVGDTSLPNITSRIICTGTASISCSNITHLEVSALAFVGCGVLSLNNAEYIKLTDTTFEDSSGSQSVGGITASLSSVSLENSCFINITASTVAAILARFSNFTIEDTCFVNNTAGVAGGGIAALNSKLTFLGRNSFIENRAPQGAALYGSECTMIFAGKNLFMGNQAISTQPTAGGAIYIQASTVEFSEETKFIQNAASFGGGVHAQNSNITFGASSVTNIEGNLAWFGGGIFIANGNVTFNGGSLFMHNVAAHGGAVHVHIGAVLRCDENCTFVSNHASSRGGAVLITNGTAILNQLTIFENNLVNFSGGAVNIYGGRLLLTGNTEFAANSAEVTGGAVNMDSSILILSGTSKFLANSATLSGGAVNVYRSSLFLTGNTEFVANDALTAGGGAIYGQDSNITSGIGANTCASNELFGAAIHKNFSCNTEGVTGGEISHGNSSFVGNTAPYGGALFMFNSCFECMGITTFRSNQAEFIGGALDAIKSRVNMTGSNIFVNNSANNQGSAIYALNDTNLYIVGSTNISNNHQPSTYTLLLGTIYANNSNVEFEGNCTFRNNTASNGGVMYLRNSTISMWGDMTFNQNSADRYGGAIYLKSVEGRLETAAFISNTAEESGGAFFISNSTLNFSDCVTMLNNSAPNQGGAILATESSQLSFSGNQILANSSARYGGAVYLAGNSLITLVSPLEFLLQNNMAERGAVIYYEDSISLLRDCQNIKEPDLSRECFLQVGNTNNSRSTSDVQLTFSNNTASVEGSVLYGGMLDRCTPKEYNGSGLMLLNEISTHTTDVSTTPNISSDAFRICFCDRNMQPDCSLQSPQITVRRGELFTINAVAAGQGNFTVQSTIQANFPSSNTDIMNGESETCQSRSQESDTCIELNYRVFSIESSVLLRLYPDGPCRDIGTEQPIHVTLLPCPIGFEQVGSRCICEQRLMQFTSECNIDNLTVERRSNFWVRPLFDNRTYTGLILHSQCPFDYCIMPPSYIDPSNSDSQCDFNCSGMLCGSCEPELSVVFGSFHCLQCSNAYLALFVPFALAGIALVLLLFLLQLTVSIGTVNGLIFYANIVAGNKAIFLTYGDTNLLTVFIAWLNLDLGIETCFYDGMDTYARTWLQFVFPLYVWTLVGLLILVSRYSQKIATILGNHHPVPVLATLFLLSYAKILRTIITAFSATFLDYPDGSNKAVWLYDGNIEYFQGKHIPLFLAALIALLVLFLPYTFLLLFGQWLQAYSEWRVLSWINKLKPFMDAYHGPYKNKMRFWTGLLLLLRCALLLVNSVGDSNVSLLAIATIMFGLTVMVWLTGKIYKNWYLDALESFFVLNIGILAVATYHTKIVSGNQNVLTYISMGTVFVAFLGILLFHVYIQVKDTNFCIKIRNCRNRPADENENKQGPVEAQPQIICNVTTTFIELREPVLDH